MSDGPTLHPERTSTDGDSLVLATTAEDFRMAGDLFRAYVASVAQPQCFEGFEGELQRLAELYGPPLAGLVLAMRGGQAAGCCAFRARPDTDHVNACEMKRLYVSPAYRSLGIGHRLVHHVMETARVFGYSCMLLDTLSEMETARALYEEVGFFEIPPYAPTPIPGAHHLKVML